MSRVEVTKGDITKIQTDAIVNAANNFLLGGGGVDGAIHLAGGPTILEECRTIGYCSTGEAVITRGGKLPAPFIIHTVGPVWKGGRSNERELLRSSYINSLKIAEKNCIKTVAFPNISTGIYGFPKKDAAKIAIKTVKDYLKENSYIELVKFVCFDSENWELYRELLG